MKIEVHGDTGLVESVYADVDENSGLLHLFITTSERWVSHQLSGGQGHFSRMCPEGAAPPRHRLIAIGDAHLEALCAEVVFLPDNDHEAGLLFGSAFHQQEKDQLHYLVLPAQTRAPSTPRRERTFAQWRSRSSA
jgi:hypothetical protein